MNSSTIWQNDDQTKSRNTNREGGVDRSKWPARHFDTYNFHPSSLLDLLGGAIGPSSQRAPVFLIGERGIGRTYLLDASAHRLRGEGADVSVLHLDLEGYEPDQDISAFVQHHGVKRGESDSGLFAEPLRLSNSKSLWAALLVALLYSCPEAERQVQAISLGDSTWGTLKDRDKLFLLLAKLAADKRIVLHIEDVCYIPGPVLQALKAAAEANPNLVLAFSCGANDLKWRVHRSAVKDFVYIHATRLTSDQLKSILDRNFEHNSFPSRFSELLWQVSLGLPTIAAVLMQDYVLRGLVRREPDGVWRISDKSLLASRESLRPDNDIVGGLLSENRLAPSLRRFLPPYLFLAGLCQENIPASLLLQYIGLNGEMADQFLDFVDEARMRGAHLFIDFQYRHPSYPQQAVYQFTDSLGWRAAFESVTRAEGSRLATGFFSFLKRQLCVDTHGACRLLLSAAMAAGLDSEADRCRRESAWWIAEEEAQHLTDSLITSIARDQIIPESVWSIFEDTAHRWPAYRRMALLDAYRRYPDRTPKYRMGESRYARTRLLRDLGRTGEAMEEALGALEELENEQAQDPIALTGCHTFMGGSYRKLGQAEKARQHLDLAIKLSARIGDRLHSSLVSILHELAVEFRMLGENEIAKPLLERAIELADLQYGLENRSVADLLKSLADLLRETGDLDGASSCLERALEICERIYGRESSRIATLHKILVDDLFALGKPQLARGHLEEALKIETALHGGQSETASTLLKHMADLSCQSGDFMAASTYLQRALLIDEAQYGSASPHLAVQIKNLADIFLKLGNIEATVNYLKCALRIEEDFYGRSDPRILQNLAYLEAILRQTGQIEAANEYLERLHSIQQFQPG